jgi:hypothetical protein
LYKFLLLASLSLDFALCDIVTLPQLSEE